MGATYWSLDECRWVGWSLAESAASGGVDVDVTAAIPGQPAGSAERPAVST
jgi:hypothetical protein